MSMSLISTITVGAGGAATIDFTSIPGTFTDLMLVHSLRSNSTDGPAFSANITFNNSGSGYTERILYNNSGGGAASGTRSGAFLDWAGLSPASGTGSTANTFGSGRLYVANYTSSAAKSISSDSAQESNTTNGAYWNFYSVAASWSGTAAITSLKLTASAGSFMQYSTASLYGITKGSGGATVA